jgi:hypothetical protein
LIKKKRLIQKRATKKQKGSTANMEKMASKAEEDAFVKRGMAAVQIEHSIYLQSKVSGKSCIALPTDAYESLLRAVFHNTLPLSILGKDKTVKPVRFDSTKQVFFASDPEDGRLLVPLNVICQHIAQRKQEGTPSGAITSLGAEMMRQIEGSTTRTQEEEEEEPELFLHDKAGKYVGARINNQFVPAEALNQQDGSCLVCRFKATKRCKGCKMARYCSVECQTADWGLHKTICGRLQSNKGDFVVGTRVEPNPAEVQCLISKARILQQHLAARLNQQN